MSGGGVVIAAMIRTFTTDLEVGRCMFSIIANYSADVGWEEAWRDFEMAHQQATRETGTTNES